MTGLESTDHPRGRAALLPALLPALLLAGALALLAGCDNSAETVPVNETTLLGTWATECIQEGPNAILDRNIFGNSNFFGIEDSNWNGATNCSGLPDSTTDEAGSYSLGAEQSTPSGTATRIILEIVTPAPFNEPTLVMFLDGNTIIFGDISGPLDGDGYPTTMLTDEPWTRE